MSLNPRAAKSSTSPIKRDGPVPKPDACPVCGSTEIRDAIEGASDHITGEAFRILGCDGCGVCFTFPVPRDMEPYYPLQYRGYGPLVVRILRTFYRFRVGKWARIKQGPGMALEIGCGAGLMLDALRRKGWRVKGVERTEAMAAYAKDTLGLDVISGGLDLVPREPGFDLIILFQVLEHMSDPLSILRECAARLKPDGVMVINVPNIASWQARFGGPVWLHLDPPRHLFHFSPGSLEKTLEKAGLQVSKVGFVSIEHDPYGWVESAINRITGRYNTMTRYLMGLEGFSGHVLLSFILGGVLAVPALILSVLSWIMGRGALFQIVASIPRR